MELVLQTLFSLTWERIIYFLSSINEFKHVWQHPTPCMSYEGAKFILMCIKDRLEVDSIIDLYYLSINFV